MPSQLKLWPPFNLHALLNIYESLGKIYIRGVHVVLVSLFGRPIVRSISHFFWSAKRKLSCLRDRTNFFAHSLESFVQSFFENWSPSNQRLDKKSRNDKKNNLRSLRLNTFFVGRPKKMRNWPDNWSAKRLNKTTWTSLK